MGWFFKVDFEKAYDKVKWPFLQQALRMKGFDQSWRNQVDSFTQKGSVGIKVNDDIGHYFQTHKGLRQGDPMSLILFNIVVDMFDDPNRKSQGTFSRRPCPAFSRWRCVHLTVRG